MGIPLYKILDSPGIFGSSIIAGWEGLGREVEAITVVEAPIATQWINQSDFILSSGYYFRNNIDEFVSTIEFAFDRGASGLGIPPKSFVKKIPEKVINTCDNLRFPLISLPDNSTYWIVASALFNAKEKEADYEWTTVDIIFDQLSHGLSIPSMLNILSKEVGCPVSLLDKTGECIFGSNYKGRTYVDKTHYLKRADSLKGVKKQWVVFQSEDNLKEWYFKLIARDGILGYLTFLDKENTLIKNIEQIRQISVLLASGFAKLSKTVESLKKKKRYAFYNFIIKKFPYSEAEYLTIHRSFELKGRIIIINLNFNKNEHDSKVISDITGQIEIRCQAEDSASLVTVYKNKFVILYHNTQIKSAGFQNLVSDIVKIIKKYFKYISYSIGVGNTASSLEEYRKSFLQAIQAAEIGSIKKSENEIIDYGKLGFLALIKDKSTYDFFLTISREKFKNVLNLEDSLKRDLLLSLKCFFENDCCYSLASKSMFIHENTLRYRINKLGDKINLDLNDFDNRFLVYFLIKMLELNNELDI